MEIGAGLLSLKWIYGWNSSTVQYLTSNILCYVCGNHIIFVKVDTNQIEKIYSSPGLGISAYTTNKLDSVFAYGEICVNPKIFIHNYPSLDKVCELTDGAELEINSICFSWDSHLLCSSGLPDYKLTIWKWTEAQKLCSISIDQSFQHFISFNPCNWRNICTMQKGAITWWDIYHYNKDFVFVPKKVVIPQSLLKSSMSLQRKQSYKGLSLPEIEIDPPNKYQLKTQSKQVENDPTSHCWLPNGDILVTTNKGDIWKVDGDKQNINLLWDNKSKASSFVDINISSFKITSIIYHLSGFFVGSEEGILLKFKFASARSVKVAAYCKVDVAITKLQFSPDYTTLLITCADGSVLTYPAAQEEIVPVVMFPQKRKVVGASMLPPWNKYILVLLEDGTVLTLSQDTKEVLSMLNLPSKCISLVCSPLWCGAVLGSEDGKFFILEHSKCSYPRIIHAVALDKKPIKTIKFDNSGHLIVFVCKPLIYFASGRVSSDFEIFGYIELEADVMDICSWELVRTGEVHIIFVHKEVKGKPDSHTTQFTRVQLNKNLTHAQAQHLVNTEGKFQDALVCKRTWVSSASCIGLATDISENTWYTFVASHKHIMKFGFPEFFKSYDSMSKDFLKVQVFGFSKSYHELSDLAMSTNLTYQQIATIGNDGKLICRYSNNMDSISITDADVFVEKNCQCSIFLPRSGCNILIVSNEGYLLLYNWTSPVMEAPLTIRKKSHPYRELPEFGKENMIAKIKPSYQIATHFNVDGLSPTSTDQNLSPPVKKKSTRVSVKDSFSPIEIPEPWPNFEISWLENRKQQKYEQDAENSRKQIEEMKLAIKRFGFRVAKLLVENDLLPESEQIPRQEFDLDREGQVALHDSNKSHLHTIRYTTARRNLKCNYMWNKIKKECWDAMEVKGVAINSFHADMQVSNFPLHGRSDQEQELLEKMMVKRTIEVTNHKLLVKFGLAEPVKWRVFQKELELDESLAVNPRYRIVHMGGQAVLFGIDNPFLHSQFELYTRDQKKTQVILLQDLVHKIKERFNKLFADVVNKKQAIFQKIQEKNSRMQQIVADIGLRTDLWVPSWSTDEKPEQCLVVLDHEIKSERFYTTEQRLALEKKRLEEEEMRRKKIADDFRRRAIDKMMGGVLQSRREDEIFKKEVPVPTFMAKKSPEQFNNDEKVIYQAYLAKVKEINEERDKLRKQLEVEFNRCGEIVQELAATFDEEIKELAVKKLKAQMLVFQEELKILRLNLSMAFEEELYDQQEKLMQHITNLKEKRQEVQIKISEIQKAVQLVQEEYDTVVVEERGMEKILKKELSDIPLILFEMILKLFRKKPRVQRPLYINPCQIPAVGAGNPFGDGPFGNELIQITNTIYQTALNELDDPVNSPEGILPHQWTQFCRLRRQKMDLEAQIKKKAMIIADMIAYLQSKQVESESLNKEITETNELIVKLIQEKNSVLSNLEIQIILKLGQVELDNVEGFLPDFGGALLIHRSVVEERNKQIRALGAMKQQSILESTKLLNMIELREWEHRSKQMTVEDLIEMAKDIQKMQVTQEIKNFLSSRHKASMHARQMVQLEGMLNLMIKLHEKQRQDEEKRHERVQKIKKYIESKNAFYDKKLQRINNVLSRWKLIPKAEEDTSHIPSRKFDEVVHWRGLVRQAAQQRVTLLELRKQMNFIWERSVPMLSSHEKKHGQSFV